MSAVNLALDPFISPLQMKAHLGHPAGKGEYLESVLPAIAQMRSVKNVPLKRQAEALQIAANSLSKLKYYYEKQFIFSCAKKFLSTPVESIDDGLKTNNAIREAFLNNKPNALQELSEDVANLWAKIKECELVLQETDQGFAERVFFAEKIQQDLNEENIAALIAWAQSCPQVFGAKPLLFKQTFQLASNTQSAKLLKLLMKIMNSPNWVCGEEVQTEILIQYNNLVSNTAVNGLYPFLKALLSTKKPILANKTVADIVNFGIKTKNEALLLVILNSKIQSILTDQVLQASYWFVKASLKEPIEAIWLRRHSDLTGLACHKKVAHIARHVLRDIPDLDLRAWISGAWIWSCVFLGKEMNKLFSGAAEMMNMHPPIP